MNIDIYNGLIRISRIADEIDPRHIFGRMRLDELHTKLCYLSTVLRETQTAIRSTMENGETNVGNISHE